jgi:transcriptional regulator GlxA family with amidase domain
MGKVLWMFGGLVLIGAAGFGGWLLTLPPHAPAVIASAISPDEHAATVAALKPPKRERPVIAVIGINDGTETTDYLMPTGILRRADVADVLLVATAKGPVTLYPALTVDSDFSLEQFDARYPEGADFVIVPAMRRPDDATVLAWLRAQAQSGAVIVGVCAGATIVANAGLLDGKRATTHWYYIDDMRESHPRIEYVPDRRFVVDQGVVTTTGISASMPMTLTLVEAIAGRDEAREVARDLGLESWDASHRSDSFALSREFAWQATLNKAQFWAHEKMNIELTPGMDGVSLALMADAWSRTFRSRVVTYAALPDAVETRFGMRIHPERAISGEMPPPWLEALDPDKPARVLEDALADIRNRYGRDTQSLVATQLEYPL